MYTLNVSFPRGRELRRDDSPLQISENAILKIPWLA